MTYFLVIINNVAMLLLPAPYPSEVACKAAAAVVERESRAATYARTSSAICVPRP